MKYIVILGDGMADRPVAMLNNKTPLELAKKPCIDYLANHGKCGMVKTIPTGMNPGSDVANLSVLGYAPEKYYSGRSPLEAISMNIDMLDTDVAIRCNLVTLSSEEKIYENKTMLDYSAGEISSQDAAILISAVQEELGDEIFAFYSGVSYRHCMIEHNGEVYNNLTPPHDITDKPIFEYLPKQSSLLDLMRRSYEILSQHPINSERVSKGLKPANSIWLWGAGSKPSLPLFKELYGLKGAIISAVDLLKGIGIASGMNVIAVDGATGRIDTNYQGKADACLKALEDGYDYVYLHVEAPDECGHQGLTKDKVKAIELIDSQIVGYLMQKLEGQDYGMLVCPDHATPLELKTHTSESVPYIIYRSTAEQEGIESYTEKACATTGNNFDSGVAMAEEFLTEIKTEVVAPEDITPIEAQENATANADFILPEVEKVEPVTQDEDETLPSDAQDPPQEDSANKTKKAKKQKPSTPDAKRKKTIIIASVVTALLLVIILVVSIVTPILILNKDKIFVKDASDFQNVDKGNYYVLEKDIIVNGDLNISNPYSIDLNNHSLVVNGVLSFTHNQSDTTLYLGTKKGKEYIAGGSITATSLNFDCAGKLVNHAVVSANDLRLANGESTHSRSVSVPTKLNIVGGKHTFNGALGFSEGATASFVNTNVFITSDAQAKFNITNSKVEFLSQTKPVDIILDDLSDAKIHGSVSGSVSGGNTVIMTDSSSASVVENMKTLWVGRDNQNIGMIKVDEQNINYIVHLESPIDLSVERTAEGKIIVTITKVNHANRYAVYVNDAKEPLYVDDSSSSSAIVTCDITELAASAGTHNIKVQALGAEGSDPDLIVPSQFIKAIYVHEVKLDTPSGLTTIKEDDKVFLQFNKVNFADEYLIVINGKNIVHRDIENTKIDITEHVKNVGAYSIRVQARSAKNNALKSSEVAMTSYETIRPHDGEITLTQTTEDDFMTLEWNALDSAMRYTVTITSLDGSVKTIKLHTTNFKIALSELNNGDVITVKADSIGYYLDSQYSNAIVVIK